MQLSLSLLVFVHVVFEEPWNKELSSVFFTPRSHAAESLPGFIVDNHKISLVVVVVG